MLTSNHDERGGRRKELKTKNRKGVPILRKGVPILLFFLVGVAAVAGSSTQPLWSTVQREGVHWILDPDGRPFYSKGVNFLDPGKETPQSRLMEAYFWGNFYPSLEAWRKASGERLLEWGFNTRGGWSDPSPEFPLALTVDLELGRNAQFHWFDPFHPDMEKALFEWAVRLTAPYRNDPRLLGYYTDNEVGWWNSPLFVWYLQKGWDNHTKRVLWQLLHDRYGGDWKKLLVDWVPGDSLNSFEDLRQGGAKLRLRAGGNGIQLVNQFMRLYCRHYYSLTARALRSVHPEALLLGDRLPLYYHQDAVLAMGDDVDIISTNYNVDSPDGWVAPYYFDGLRRLTDKPVLVTEFFFAAEENRSGNRNETARSRHPKPGHLMTVATQAERAKGVMNAVRNFARFPNVVGSHWFQYIDEPRGGREDGEDYNMGLIDLADRPYEAVTAVFQAENPKLDAIHEDSRTRLREETSRLEKQGNPHAPPHPVPQAVGAIRLDDQSLVDWDKESTRLHGFQTPSPYVPFGDVHLAWTPEGLYLATLANTYFDPAFLDYSGAFPPNESFQVHLAAKVSGKPVHYAIHLIPQPNPAFPDGFDIRPHLYRTRKGSPPKELGIEGKVQRIEKSLPHMVLEAFVPAEWLGLKQLKVGQELEVGLTVTSYFRELTMNWSELPELGTSGPPGKLRRIVLVGP